MKRTVGRNAATRKISRARYAKSSKCAAANSRFNLKEALIIKEPLINGWPDAGRIEQKIGSDRVKIKQWRRAAQAYSRGVIFKLLFASTHEDAAYTKNYRIIPFTAYAKEIGMLKEWKQLIGRFL